MELETIRSCAAGAADGAHGINAQIAALTLDGADARPANVTLYTSLTAGWVARRTFAIAGLNVSLPAVAIYVGDSAELEPEVATVYRDGHFPVVFAYLDEKSASETGTLNALYTNRAILRFLTWFNHNAQAATVRTRNGIIVQACTNLTQAPIAAVKGDVFIGAITQATFKVRETSA